MTVHEIERIVAAHFEVTITDMRELRAPKQAQARMAAMYFTREVLKLSYPQIGKVFRRDHTSVMKACLRVDELARENQGFAEHVRQLRLRLASGTPSGCCPTCGMPVDKQRVVDVLNRDIEALKERIALLEKTS